MAKEDRAFFDIHMLGGFTLSYEGREYALGRNSTAKFIQLIQLVWLQGAKGITKEQLMQALYDRDNLFNQNNSFNNLIYQMRKQMQHAGLPEADYISRKDGRYVTDEKIPVKIDVLEFRNLTEKADREEKEEDRFRDYGRAFEMYRGELLPSVSTEIWVTTESLQLKGMFERCVNWLGAYLKQQKNYSAMYQVYSRAAELYPFDDWQVYQIDALLCLGEYKEAFLLYDKTTRLYSEEMGLPPSDQMMKCYEQMSRKIEYCPEELSEIKDEIAKYSEIWGGGGTGHIIVPIPALSTLIIC